VHHPPFLYSFLNFVEKVLEKQTIYKPIDCSFYDELELVAMRGSETEIVYLEGEKPVRKRCIIQTIESKGGAEYLVLTDKTEIRLDNLLSIDGKIPPQQC
jgi:Rho-binding antiterminator